MIAPFSALPGRLALEADTRAFAAIHPCTHLGAPPPSSPADAADRLTRAAHHALLSFLS